MEAVINTLNDLGVSIGLNHKPGARVSGTICNAPAGKPEEEAEEAAETTLYPP
jgi:hypothetical protein